MNIHIPTWLAYPFLIPVLATVLNAFFHFRTPEGWALFCATSPRLSLVVMLASRIGIDPAGAIRDIRNWTKTFRQQGWQFGGDATDPPPAPLVLVTAADVFTAVAARTITPEQGVEALEKLREETPSDQPSPPRIQ